MYIVLYFMFYCRSVFNVLGVLILNSSNYMKRLLQNRAYHSVSTGKNSMWELEGSQELKPFIIQL
jgi:hypothetical protein